MRLPGLSQRTYSLNQDRARHSCLGSRVSLPDLAAQQRQAPHARVLVGKRRAVELDQVDLDARDA